MKSKDLTEPKFYLKALITLVLILATILFYKAKDSNINKAKRGLKTINKNFEVLEIELNGSNSKEVCLNSNESIRIIKNNKQSLKLLEPNYHWNEIKEVLTIISENYCPEFTD